MNCVVGTLLRRVLLLGSSFLPLREVHGLVNGEKENKGYKEFINRIELTFY